MFYKYVFSVFFQEYLNRINSLNMNKSTALLYSINSLAFIWVVPEVTPLSSVSLYKNTNDLFNNKYSTLEQWLAYMHIWTLQFSKYFALFGTN